jgi:hypothetical protein
VEMIGRDDAGIRPASTTGARCRRSKTLLSSIKDNCKCVSLLFNYGRAKGIPVERRGRKANGLTANEPTIARLPAPGLCALKRCHSLKLPRSTDR